MNVSSDKGNMAKRSTQKLKQTALKKDESDTTLRMNLWTSSFLPDVTFVNNSYCYHSFQPHFHDHYVIMVVDNGVNEGICEKKKYQVTTNDILFINPGEIHTGNSYRGQRLQYSAFYINTEFFTKHLLPDGSGVPPVFVKLLETNTGLTGDIRELIKCTRADGSQLEIEENKAKVFWQLMNYTRSQKQEATGNISRENIRKVKCFIKDQYNQQFSLADMTDYVGISPFHLVRSFKQEVGLTPFQFLRNYRVEKAKGELLKKKSITEVAIEVGFYDQSHFHKHFKLVTGLTPREFQRQ
jgi:AraC-like DNA-binding protein